MHVIWKRPDGFHGADPSDFTVVNLGNHSKIWLHKKDNTHFPFRIDGGWQESDASARLNTLVNLLAKDKNAWVQALTKMYHSQMGDDAGTFVDELTRWISELKDHLKGDTWEMEIMSQALREVLERMHEVRDQVIHAAKS